LHSVAERYLSADDNGRVPEPPSAAIDMNLCWDEGPLAGQKWGEAVNLYPDGWDDPLTPADSVLIKRLIQMGIEAGVLERREGRKIEGRFERPMLDDHVLVGFIDLEMPGEIQDHKTTKAMRWAKGAAQLRTNIQMLVYAWEYFQRTDDDEVVIRHNTFCKGVGAAPAVRHRETTVTREYVLEWWTSKIVPLMAELAEDDEKTDWTEVEEARPGSGACEKYGGCERVLLCTGFETFEQHIARLDPMGVFDSMSKETKKEAPVAPVALVVPEPAAPVTLTQVSPPWTNPDCDVCEGGGFNAKGNPCKMCDADAIEANRSKNYDLATDDAGNRTWTAKRAEPAPAPGTLVVDEERAAVVDDAPVAAAVVDDVEVPKAKRGRPKQGFTLMIGCAMERSTGATMIYTDQLLRELGDGLAKAAGHDTYYDLDAFGRRDAIAKRAAAICENFSSRTYVIANGESPDVRAFVDALRPFAANVIVGAS
jgi:hypothetical protein